VDILSRITFLPLVAAVLVAFMPARAHRAIKWFSFAATAAVFLVSIGLVRQFDAIPGMQMTVNKGWLPSLGISYHLGIDGISLFLVMLVTFLTPITILACFNSIETRVKEFFICMLFLETAMIGAFVALDLFLFYMFWEAMLIPMYFMIGMWGGERRVYATVKFFIYTMIGSLLMLVAILYVVHVHKAQTGTLSFDLPVLLETTLSAPQQWLLFLAFALASRRPRPVR
jgi:NADH-quinone oxidoreductase subunit M